MDEQLNAHIGKRLRAARRALSLSQSDLGAMTAIRFRQIHKYEVGENRMSASILWKFACALNVPVQYFFEGMMEKQPALHLVETAGDARATDEPVDLPIYARRSAAEPGPRLRQALR
jgi:transcriptional regulator with XRE-family HTH domain